MSNELDVDDTEDEEIELDDEDVILVEESVGNRLVMTAFAMATPISLHFSAVSILYGSRLEIKIEETDWPDRELAEFEDVDDVDEDKLDKPSS